MPQLSVLSTQYVLIPVRAWEQGVLYNPTGDTVQFAFVSSGTPTLADWNTAGWAGTVSLNGVYYAQCLVGPQNSGVILPQGSYNVWIQVTDNPEVPVVNTGALTITP